MAAEYTPGRTNFGLLPEPERSPASFATAAVINSLIVAGVIALGMMTKHVIDNHKYENTILIVPQQPPPPIKLPPPPKIIDLPKPPEIKLDQPKIVMPKIEPKPDEAIKMEEKIKLPEIKEKQQQVALAPQPKPVMPVTVAAPDKPKVMGTVAHVGDPQGVIVNPNANKPATVAALGSLGGGNSGPQRAYGGKVGSVGSGIGAATKNAYTGQQVGTVQGLPTPAIATTQQPTQQQVATTAIEVLSKPPVQYTSEARQLGIQGNVVLRVTFTANGQVQVQGVVKGLGHGLDEEAQRVAKQIRFRPATRNGQAVDSTTTITISFQLA